MLSPVEANYGRSLLGDLDRDGFVVMSVRVTRRSLWRPTGRVVRIGVCPRSLAPSRRRRAEQGLALRGNAAPCDTGCVAVCQGVSTAIAIAIRSGARQEVMEKFTLLHGMALAGTLAAILSVAFSPGEPPAAPAREASTVMFTVCVPFGACYDYTCNDDHTGCRMIKQQPGAA